MYQNCLYWKYEFVVNTFVVMYGEKIAIKTKPNAYSHVPNAVSCECCKEL